MFSTRTGLLSDKKGPVASACSLLSVLTSVETSVYLFTYLISPIKVTVNFQQYSYSLARFSPNHLLE